MPACRRQAYRPPVKHHQAGIFSPCSARPAECSRRSAVGAQEAENDAGHQQAGGVADAEREVAELYGDLADQKADDEEAQNASRSVTWL